MPRKARAKSSTGCYHILLTSEAGRKLFYKKEDYFKFINIIKDYSKLLSCIICAYSLMPDHAHILVQLPNNNPGDFVKRISTKYAFYVNKEQGTSGSVFYDRFRSQPVDTVGDYSKALVGIHKAASNLNIAKDFAAYPYSSYSDYVNDITSVIDPTITFNMLNKKQFVLIHEEEPDMGFMRVSRFRGNISTELANKFAKEVMGKYYKNSEKISSSEVMDQIVIGLVNKHLSVNQIIQFTGASIPTINMIIKKAKTEKKILS